MIEVEHRRDIDLPAETVWEEVRHFDRVLHWVPGGAESTIAVTGSGVGALRDIHLVTQGYVQHRLVAFSDAQRTFSYELTAGKPIGMQDYVVVATVTPLDPQHCMIRWAGRMTADSGLDEVEIGRALQVALGKAALDIVVVIIERGDLVHEIDVAAVFAIAQLGGGFEHRLHGRHTQPGGGRWFGR